MIDEMVTWLCTQVDDDMRVARDADVKQGDPGWFVSPVLAAPGNFTIRSKRDMRPIARVQHLDGDEGDPVILDGAAVAEHIARHDPAWAQLDVVAKQKILDRYDDCRARRDDPDYPSIAAIEQMREYEDFILPALALSYAGRPGFQEVWAL